MNLSVIIPNRNDENLPHTIRRIEESLVPDLPEIVVVNDGIGICNNLPKHVLQICNDEPMGTSYSRHVGIMAASNNHTISIDAHMEFHNDYDWGNKVINELSKANNLVLCGEMVALTPENRILTPNMNTYKGARIKLLHNNKNGENFALSGVWTNNKVYDEISCVMGACYAINKDWYIDGLNQPWSLGRGWGNDEETLSISNWLCNGKTILVPIEFGHIAFPKRSFVYKKEDLEAVWYNRLRMAYMFPMQESLREKLADWILTCRSIISYKSGANNILNSIDYKSYRMYLESHGKTLEDFLDYFKIVDEINV